MTHPLNTVALPLYTAGTRPEVLSLACAWEALYSGLERADKAAGLHGPYG